MAAPQDTLDRTLARISRSTFRAGFHLRAQERRIVDDRGLPTVREHALRLIADRLGPAHPRRDGRQTPWGGHPVFRAQHATATCCRGCLSRNHGIPEGVPLDTAQIDGIADLICRWIEVEMRRPTAPRRNERRHDQQPTLF